MKRIISLLVAGIILTTHYSKADEGMWLLPLLEELNMSDMEQLGIQLTAEQIYSINHSSIKDAIVIFGRGCTGEIVSPDGLLFTNHHCGYDQIQQHSTVEHDYLKDGYWAMDRSEELPNPDLMVRFLERIEDVSGKIFEELSDTMTEENRRSQIKETVKRLEQEASEGEKYDAVVRSLFDGNEYYLFVYTVFRDVRFVGAPPSAIGKFGYDTDNWEWPRHTGDFSVFRVYTAPDGSPAEYSPDNIPLKPKYFLPISLEGMELDDFAFILGYPGRTNRYLSSYGIREKMDVINTNRIRIRGNRLDLLMKDMQNDPKIRIQYASKYFRSSNYWKYSIGQNQGLRTLKIIDKKEMEEAAFQQWVEEDSMRNVKYGSILNEIKEIYAGKKSAEQNFNAINETFFTACELIGFLADFQYLRVMLTMDDFETEEIRKEIEDLKDQARDFFKDYHLPTDLKVTKNMFSLYREMISPGRLPEIYDQIDKKYKGDVDRFVDHMFAKTLFTDEDKVLNFLENPSLKVLAKDKAFQVANSIMRKYFEEYNILNAIDTKLQRDERLYLAGRMKMNPDLKYYPDANFTMRLTYGSVQNYSPRDAVHYDEFTFLKGVMEKEDTTNFEFIVPHRLKELYTNKDYGIYGIGERMPVCFITNNDITGGNSGSPVLNARGELVGLAFDGNWEAMSGDIAFEPDIQRCICVDIRYVLFIIDKFAGAHYLINELELVE